VRAKPGDSRDGPDRTLTIFKALDNHRIGVVLLAGLAVDKSQQRNGLLRSLPFDALTRAGAAADIIGVRTVLVRPIDEPAGRFYLHFAF
jgi:hypothetical protein